MPADNQNGQAPDPGPSPSIQPIFSSALLTINPMEHNANKIANINSAVRTVILQPVPVSFYLQFGSLIVDVATGLRVLAQPATSLNDLNNDLNLVNF